MKRSKNRDLLSRPICFTGMGRSGSTVIYEAFSAHDDLGWLSNYSRIAPCCPVLNTIVRIVDNRLWFIRGAKHQGQTLRRFNRVLPRPDESYPFWREYVGEKFSRSFLRGVKASENEAQTLRSVFARTLICQGKRRLVGKITGPPRIGYMSSVFPDMIFINIVRDGRAVVRSLLNVAFWREKGGLEKPYWDDGLDPPDLEIWEASGRDPVVLASLQWCKTIEVARCEKVQLAPGQYMEIRYEDFVKKPINILNELFDHCGLARSDRVSSYVERWGQIKDMNDKYKEMSSDDIQKMEDVMGVYLKEFGYT